MSAAEILLRVTIALAWMLAIATGIVGVVLALVPIIVACAALEAWRSWRPA